VTHPEGEPWYDDELVLVAAPSFARRAATDPERAPFVTFGRGSTIVLTGLGLAWIPMMKYVSPQIYIYLQSVQAYIAPPIAACFLLGVLNKRLNGTGAMWALISGLVIGAARLVLELNRSDLTPGSALHWFATVNFLHFAAYLFVLSCLILAVVSLMTKPPASARLDDLTTKAAAVPAAAEDDPAMRKGNIIASVLLAALIGVLWIIFR